MLPLTAIPISSEAHTLPCITHLVPQTWGGPPDSRLQMVCPSRHDLGIGVQKALRSPALCTRCQRVNLSTSSRLGRSRVVLHEAALGSSTCLLASEQPIALMA